MLNQNQLLYGFSEFIVDPARRTLSRNGEPVALWPKVFDILLLLVQNSGRILEKHEMMQALWPESFVEEGNLSQNIFVLRRVLGDDRNGHSFIKTIPRRGYKFIAPVRQVGASGVDDILTGSAAARAAMEYWGRRGPARGLRIFERTAGGGQRRTG